MPDHWTSQVENGMLVRRAQFGDHPGHPPIMRRRRPRSPPPSSQRGGLCSPAGSLGGGKKGVRAAWSMCALAGLLWIEESLDDEGWAVPALPACVDDRPPLQGNGWPRRLARRGQIGVAAAGIAREQAIARHGHRRHACPELRRGAQPFHPSRGGNRGRVEPRSASRHAHQHGSPARSLTALP